jgi:hypothetical protein
MIFNMFLHISAQQPFYTPLENVTLYLVRHQIFQLLRFLCYKFKQVAYNQTLSFPSVGYCTALIAVLLYLLTNGLKYQQARLQVTGCAGQHNTKHSTTLNIHKVYYFPTKEQQPRQPKMRGSTVGNTAGTSRIVLMQKTDFGSIEITSVLFPLCYSRISHI